MLGHFDNSISEASRWQGNYRLPTVRYQQNPSVRDERPRPAEDKSKYSKFKQNGNLQYIPSVTVRTQIHVVKK